MRCYIFLNTFLRSPNLFFLDNQENRISYIVRYVLFCSRYIGAKCIGLSEVFGAYNINKLSQEFSKYGYVLLVPNSNVYVGSGLAFAYNPNDFLVMSHKFVPYSTSCFPDNLANKGYFIVKLRLFM